MSNNLPTPSTSTDSLPLRFHNRHGKNIRITNEGTVARRTNTNFFTRGLVFSARPIRINEKIYFKLVEVTDNVGGFVYVGFTSKNPENLHGVTCASLADKPGYWSWFFPKNLCERNTVLFYYVTASGEVHYGVENVEKGLFGGKIQMRNSLWALIDIFGNSNAIKLVDFTPPPRKDTLKLTQKYVPSMLHRTHGRNVKVVKNTAQRIDNEYNQGYVFTQKPLQIDEVIVIQIAPDHQARFQGFLHLGVTSCDPGILNWDDLPDDANLLINRPEYWVLICDFTNLNSSDEISLSLSQNGQISFRLNGDKFAGVVHVDHTLKLWVFVNIYGSTQPICVLSCSERVDDKKNKDKECVVCYDNIIDTALYRCGHTCMCYDCAVQQWQGKGHGHCPLCRAVIKDVIRINK
ncbi:Neuralized, zf-C3HC4 3, and/or Nup160 domain containing protein [Asbolus verrucosus]|uniref:Neuralized, zf-C3HC4 3, and/or Nup160 domain containing protein n=1 Tax=Asbolus verrucosus TaxID=1661398 RepID=A0A482VTV7_ASBVE|nr:Neuralized, zf-C3HC4 3, and/or Nup160 domain containing protein [Asbolus verrucosus]